MKTEEIIQCPNCGAKLKGFLSQSILSANKTAIINEFQEKKSSHYCTAISCGINLYEKAKGLLSKEKDIATKNIEKCFESIPVISIHSPLNWDYEILGLVTGQSTTGTGLLTEFTSSFTDLFGAQSGRHNQKLKEGENLCIAQLKKQTLEMGGNAIIACDLDYSEIGSSKGMLMVCMTGTAINLKNFSILGENKTETLRKLFDNHKTLNHLNSFTIE